MAYKDYEEDANRLVAGRRASDPKKLDGDYHDVLAEFYRSPLFFIPSACLLRGAGKPIHDALSEIIAELEKADEDDDAREKYRGKISGRDDINAAAGGKPVTLAAGLRLDRSFAILEDQAPKKLRKQLTVLSEDPHAQITKQRAEKSVSENGLVPDKGQPQFFYRIPTMGIIPCLHQVDHTHLKLLQQRSGLGANKLSERVFGDGLHTMYDTLVQDRPRVTKHFAAFAARMFKQSLQKHPGFVGRDFEENAMFRVETTAKRREVALGPKNGNRVPGWSEFRRAARD